MTAFPKYQLNVAASQSISAPASERSTKPFARRCLINLALLATVGLGLSLTPQASQAGDIDLRNGTFRSNWCGFDARIQLTRRPGPDFIFDGTVTIEATGQVDKVFVRQLDDDSLHMVRYLSGSHSGQTQVMVTHPPELLKREDGKTVANFATKKTYGYGAKLAGFLRMTMR